MRAKQVRRTNSVCVLRIAAALIALAPTTAWAQDQTARLFHLIEAGDTAAVANYISAYPRALQTGDEDGKTALHWAVDRGDVGMVAFLVSRGAPLDARDHLGWTPLHMASAQARLVLVRLLVQKGADVSVRNGRGRTPLFLAAMSHGDTAIGKMLLDAGAEVDAAEPGGGTPLTYSAFRRFNAFSDLLLDHGARIQTRGDLWLAVFHRACSAGHQRLAEAFLASGIDVNARDENGRVALHSVAEGGLSELVGPLIERGNRVDEVDFNGLTPLHLAAAAGHRAVIDALVRVGADLNARNAMGETPFNLATRHGHTDAMRRLEELGADPSQPRFPTRRGAYLGEEAPGGTPTVFAPGLVSSSATIHGVPTFSSDGREIVWSVVDPSKRGSSLLSMRMEQDRWTPPQTPSFSSVAADDVPFFSPDGSGLYFLSDRPTVAEGERGRERIWFVEKDDSAWGAPRLLDTPANEMHLHWQFSVSRSGTLYFGSEDGQGRGLTDIYRSELVDGAYQEPENLGEAINSPQADFAPLVAPDESFLVFTSVSRPDSRGGADLYISFRTEEGGWTEARNLGPPVNGPGGELLASLSPDGRYLLYTGTRNGRKGVFWVGSSVFLGAETPPDRQDHNREVFRAEGSLVTEGRVFSVASHDFDGDGLLDLAVADYLHPARVLYNDEAQAFGRVVPVASGGETSTSGHGVAMGDFDGDGHADLLLVYNHAPARLLLGDGHGGFRDSGRAIGSPDLAGTSVAVADVDGDRDLDAFVTYYQAPAHLYLNDGAGAFTASEQTFFSGIALGDIDGDGDVDVVSLREAGPASIWTNIDGHFTLQDDTVGGSDGIGYIALVDIDGDGDLDVVAGGRTTQGALWENDRRGGFRRASQTFESGTKIAAGDLDGDGDTDLVIGPAVWINTGTGRFAKVQTLPIAPTTALHLADIDGDGDLDLLGASLDRETGRADLRLFRNRLSGG